MLWRTNLGAASWQPCSGSRRHRSTASPSTPHPMSPPSEAARPLTAARPGWPVASSSPPRFGSKVGRDGYKARCDAGFGAPLRAEPPGALGFRCPFGYGLRRWVCTHASHLAGEPVPTRDSARTAKSKNYRRSINVQVVARAREQCIVAVGHAWPGTATTSSCTVPPSPASVAPTHPPARVRACQRLPWGPVADHPGPRSERAHRLGPALRPAPQTPGPCRAHHRRTGMLGGAPPPASPWSPHRPDHPSRVRSPQPETRPPGLNPLRSNRSRP